MNRRRWIIGLLWLLISVAPAVAAEPAAREVWVTATVSDPDPYAGQQITYRFALYQSVRVTDATLQPPAFDGFIAKEIADRASRRETIDGREYVVTEIYYVLVPLAPGAHTIGAATLQLGIVRPDRQRRRTPFDDFFDDPFILRGRVEPRVLKSQPLAVTVRPLPPWDGPFPFSGLIGEFDMTAAIDNTRLKVGDSTTLTLSIQGRGNIADAAPPPIAMPETIKTYADAPDEQIELTADGYQGKKSFRTALVPVQAGDVPLPGAQMVYFDVVQETYRTLTVPLPALSVAPGEAAPAFPPAAGPAAAQPEKSAVTFTGRDILPPKEGLTALTPHRPLTWPMLLLGLLLPAAGFGATVLIQRARRMDRHPVARMRNRTRQAMKTARVQIAADASAFLTALYQALTSAIFARIGRSGEALAWKEAETLLCGHGVDPELSRQAAELLTQIESSKFSGARISREERERLLVGTRQMIRRLIP
ncbi:BatD family protein [Desulfatitalea tepidiphila]|uniref:BatD family protein n=1 Tax=Desulfatitalea tepidiphila TaxID=1185843 RepID=UPI0006B4CD11|nr:BatD family protein [Desulfatitalea tepidiphila]